MRVGRELYYSKLALATGIAFYTGHHREYGLESGRLVIPLGNRDRAKPEYGIEYIEERGNDANAWRI